MLSRHKAGRDWGRKRSRSEETDNRQLCWAVQRRGVRLRAVSDAEVCLLPRPERSGGVATDVRCHGTLLKCHALCGVILNSLYSFCVALLICWSKWKQLEPFTVILVPLCQTTTFWWPDSEIYHLTNWSLQKIVKVRSEILIMIMMKIRAGEITLSSFSSGRFPLCQILTFPTMQPNLWWRCVSVFVVVV